MKKSTTAPKYASDPESASASASEDEDVNSDGEKTPVKDTIGKVKSMLGFGEEESDNPDVVSGSETETETEGDDSEGEEGEGEGEGEGEEKPSVKSGFSKLLGSLKKAVSSMGSDSGSAAVEAEQANIDKSSRGKGKSVASAAAAAAASSKSASSRRKKTRGIQPTEEELAYKSEEGEEGNSDDENMDEDDDDDSKLKKFDKELREDYLVNFHPESLIQNYDEIYNLARVVRDANGVVVDNLHNTLPMMTKYEKTRIWGQRAKQINDGATPFVKVPEGVIDGYLIALKELEEKKIPFIIRRPLPNRGSEYWMVEDLEIII
jgi:DNA-directed RNA polymerase I, II, and III subunit RPABC2